jgi:hypothetical protein
MKSNTELQKQNHDLQKEDLGKIYSIYIEQKCPKISYYLYKNIYENNVT